MHLVLKFWLWGRFVAEKQTYVLNLMAGHLLNMTYNENDKWNVWELDHYTDRSSLGIHFWDLCWKMVYLKFENFWYSNVRPWETVQIWGDCPYCTRYSVPRARKRGYILIATNCGQPLFSPTGKKWKHWVQTWSKTFRGKTQNTFLLHNLQMGVGCATSMKNVLVHKR